MPELLLKANHRRPLSSLVCRNSESAANRELDLELLVGRLHTKIITLCKNLVPKPLASVHLGL